MAAMLIMARINTKKATLMDLLREMVRPREMVSGPEIFRFKGLSFRGFGLAIDPDVRPGPGTGVVDSGMPFERRMGLAGFDGGGFGACAGTDLGGWLREADGDTCLGMTVETVSRRGLSICSGADPVLT
jgi:hypothetical protein